MARKKCTVCFNSNIILVILSALLFFFIINNLQKIPQYIQHIPTQPPIYYKQGDIIMDPYHPPLKENKLFTRNIGIPINIPTSTVDTNYGSVGILSRINGKETILPLFGRPLHFGRSKWQYYAMSDKNNNIKLPVINAGKSCTGEYGCETLNNGDTVYVEGYKDAFKTTIYENNAPRYIPF